MKLTDLFEAGEFHPKTLKHSPEDLANVVKAHCGQILTAYKKSQRGLFRGVDGANMTADSISVNIRNERKPIDVGIKMHNVLHDTFVGLGLEATRKNSIFCTTDRSAARDWGTPVLVFPKDGWSGTVFEKFKRTMAYNAIYDLERKFDDSDITVEKLTPLVTKWMPLKVTEKNIATLLPNYFEVLISGQSYIGVNIEKKSDFLIDFLALLDLDLKNLKL